MSGAVGTALAAGFPAPLNTAVKGITDHVASAAMKNQEFFIDEGRKLLDLQTNNYHKAYKHDLKVTVAYQSPNIVATNFIDDKGEFNKNFICDRAAGHPMPPTASFLTGNIDKRPRIDLSKKVENIHAKFVDKTTGKVHWDVVYDFHKVDDETAKDGAVAGSSEFFDLLQNDIFGGAKTSASILQWSEKIPFLGRMAKARVGGAQQDFLQICPPKSDPPHWYELSLFDEGAPPDRYNGGNLIGKMLFVEQHPLDVPNENIAHKEADILEKAMPEMVMFAQS
ncbi:unnamed protein product [Amoebophrya sp. A120]|nr:unnamed protein product [Amoebophrya sp. A120]|eukprot:GSA120T00025047001.1